MKQCRPCRACNEPREPGERRRTARDVGRLPGALEEQILASLVYPGDCDLAAFLDGNRRDVDIGMARLVLPPRAALAAPYCDFGAALHAEPGDQRGEKIHEGLTAPGGRSLY